MSHLNLSSVSRPTDTPETPREHVAAGWLAEMEASPELHDDVLPRYYALRSEGLSLYDAMSQAIDEADEAFLMLPW